VIAAFLDGREALAARRRARAWLDRWSGALLLLRRERGRARRRPGPRPAPPPAPPPRGSAPRGKGKRAKSSPPPPPPSPPPPSPPPGVDLPRTPAEARAVLGVGEDATAKEVDAAFRKGSRRCHPDLVSHLDEDFQALAHGKFLRLKAAHDLLRGGAGRGPRPPSSKPGSAAP